MKKNNRYGRSTRFKLIEKSIAFWDSNASELDLFIIGFLGYLLKTKYDDVMAAKYWMIKLLMNIETSTWEGDDDKSAPAYGIGWDQRHRSDQ